MTDPTPAAPPAVAVTVASVLLAVLALRLAVGAGAVHEPVAGMETALHLLLLGAAAALLLLRAAAAREERAGWLLIGLGVLSWGLGDAIFSLVLADLDSIPFPSVSDPLYAGFLPFTYLGLLMLLRHRLGVRRSGLCVEGVVGCLLAGAFASAVLFDAIVDSTGGSVATVAVNLAYPLGDAVLIALVVTTLALSGRRPDRFWSFVLGGLLTIAAADVLYLWETATAAYMPGNAIDGLWVVGMLALAFAAWQTTPPAPAAELHGRQALAMPLGYGLAALALLGYASFGQMNGLAIVLAMAALGGVLLRAASIFRANLELLDQSRHDALTDALTGLGNRRHLLATLEAELPADPARPRLLVLLDLDGFKDYNDLYGHSAGDALLVRLAGNLADVVRPWRGSAYRMGGDEFCVLIDWEPTASSDRVEAVTSALAESGGAFEVRASRGAVALGVEAEDAEAALHLADKRMYAHKASANRDFARQARAVLLEALGAREPDLRDHVDGVAELCRAVGKRLGMNPEELDELVRAAELHDIGKLAIPDTILSKPGLLDDTEWAFMRRHTVIGEAILSAAPALRPVARIVRSTHERWDGGGYPDGRRAEEIPLGARIVFVCDTFHAMTSDRCYRMARTEDEALAELSACAGTQFDPEVVRVFRDVVAERRAARRSITVA